MNSNAEITFAQEIEEGTMLPLMEEFYTIQGEGAKAKTS